MNKSYYEMKILELLAAIHDEECANYDDKVEGRVWRQRTCLKLIEILAEAANR
jgi:hypothetical protein